MLAPVRRVLRSGVAAAVLGLAAPLAILQAQDAYPVVELRQINGTGGSTWASSARLSLDRDAFVVVFELGVDGRARILQPVSPRDDAYLTAKRPWYVPLPSVDAMFVQSHVMRTPTLVAFASDVAPDLSEFTSTGNRWDYMFAVPNGAERDMALRELATMLYGTPDMPYSVAESRIAPIIPLAAQRALSSCGYRVGAYGSAQFMDFLWDVFGPLHVWGTGRSSLVPWRNHNFVMAFDFPLGIWGNFSPLAFTRFTSSSLWNRFGTGCQGLQRLGFNQIAVVNDSILEQMRSQPVPPDAGPRGPHGTDGDTGVVPPGGMTRRADRLRGATTAAETATAGNAEAADALRREANLDLLQRAEVRALVARLAVQRASGAPTVAMNEALWDALRRAPVADNRSTGGFGGFGRASRSGGSSGIGSGGGSVGTAGSSSSAGSAGTSSAGRSSGGRSSSGRSGSGRGGSGRGDPFQ